MTTWLSEHFTLEELTATDHRGIDNAPPAGVLANLRETARRMEEVRAILGDNVVTVSSGYRSPALNRAVGGSKTSAHLTGWAVDFNCRRVGSPLLVAQRIADAGVEFDQLIHEFGRWVHISFEPRPMRGQLLTIDSPAGRTRTRVGLLPV